MSRLHLLLASVLLLALIALAPMAAAAAVEGNKVVFGDELIKMYNELIKSGKVSPQTQACLSCHIKYTPDIVYEWLNSAHAKHVPDDVKKLYEAMNATEWVDKAPAPKFRGYKYVVGCYECHGMFADQNRPDVVNHFGFKIVTIVTRKDCGQCHPKENAEISWTWHATAALNAPFIPWYKKLLAYFKKMGANPFGDENAKKMYEEYFPPYLTEKRDMQPVYWNFIEKYLKALYDYLNGKATEEEKKLLEEVKEATGMITPYDLDFKNIVSPLYPASGGLNTTVLYRDHVKLTVAALGMPEYSQVVSNVMSHEYFRNAYVYHACLECHGSLVIPYKVEHVEIHGMTVTRMAYWGWPSNGAGRIDPDGSIGTCTACHPRHLFSVKQARKPWTCGQCHLGYDHPHIEIYEESKHGNIENAYGSHWNWERIPWRVGIDFNAPTCATCHMSTISRVGPDGKEVIVVKGTHDLEARLVWDQMHFFAIPKIVIPDKAQVALFLGGFSALKNDMQAALEAAKKIPPNSTYKYPVFMGFEIKDTCKTGQVCFPRLPEIKFTGELAKHRQEMIKVCTLCHSHQWAEHYFRVADWNMIDYDIVAHFAFNLLKLAWKLGIQDPKNKLDEFMEVMWYYIWHHQGRRWRNGAFMMGPDYTHWFGIVDTVMEALNKMISYFDIALKIKTLKTEIEALKAAAKGAHYQPALAAKIAELEQQLMTLQQKLAALEEQVPTILNSIKSVETDVSSLTESLKTLSESVKSVNEKLAAFKNLPSKADIEKIMQEIENLKKLAQQLPAAAPQKEEMMKMLSDIEKTLKELQNIREEIKMSTSAAENIATQIGTLNTKVSSIKESLDSMAATMMAAAAIAIIIALVGAIIAISRR